MFDDDDRDAACFMGRDPFELTTSQGHLLNRLPVAVYTTDRDGRITFFNEQAASRWGRRPKLGDAGERFCGSFKRSRPDGTALTPEQTPVAFALHSGAGARNAEVIIERPDGSRLEVCINVELVRDHSGTITGAINVFTESPKRQDHAPPRRETSVKASEDAIAKKEIAEFTDVRKELADTRERLEAALSAGEVATWVWDVPSDRVYAD